VKSMLYQCSGSSGDEKGKALLVVPIEFKPSQASDVSQTRIVPAMSPSPELRPGVDEQMEGPLRGHEND
jgi:hypothetical protein